MKSKNFILVFIILLSTLKVHGQTNFSNNPLEAKFITEDVERFWEAFDRMDSSETNPFNEYIERGSLGIIGFKAYGITDANSLYQTVIKRKEDYEKSRNVLQDLESKKKRLQAIYAAMKYWYPESTFPPIYFVVGTFNAGGTASEDGLILGAEMLKGLDELPGMAAHELVHFNQTIEFGNLLSQAIKEGSADFIGELISGENINSIPFNYGNQNEEKLCKEFVLKMSKEERKDYTDWLYGRTSGKDDGTSDKDDRPHDLGYWMGYKITEAYFNKQEDKHQAIHNILNIKDPVKFSKESGFLDIYIDQAAQTTGKPKGDFYRKYSEAAFEITFNVIVPNKNDEVYITGDQPELGNWNPNQLKLKKTSDFERQITLNIHSPAKFKFTRGTWDTEALIKGIEGIPNLKIEADKVKEAKYIVTNWKDRQD